MTTYKPVDALAGVQIPAFKTPASTVDSSLASLPVFTNPVQGHVDTGVTHTGDVGGAAAA